MENVGIMIGVAIPALLVASLFLWGRGIIKARKADLIIGFTLFVLLCGYFVVCGMSLFDGLGHLVGFILFTQKLTINKRG